MRTIFLVGMIGVLLGLAVGMGARTAFAGPSNGPRFIRTVTAVMERGRLTTVDLVPARSPAGDLRVAYGPLFNATGTRQIGRVDLLTALTEPASLPERGFHLKQITLTLSLPGGAITGQALTPVSHATLSALPSTGAITGGTGVYDGARGQFHLVAHGTNRVFTLQLLP